MPTAHRSAFCALISLLLLTVVAQGQTIIKGTVLNAATNERVPSANVFINGTAYHSPTDTLGTYMLSNLPAGRYTVVVSCVGFVVQASSVTVAEKGAMTVNFRLVPDQKTLQEVSVKIKREKTWDKQLAVFTKQFLGESQSAAYCKLVNSWVLNFGETNGTLTAKADDILEIDNQYLGYKVYYSLNQFSYDGTNVSYSGYSNFNEYYTKDSVVKAGWRAHRYRVYNSSDIHFFKAIAALKTPAAAYEAYLDKATVDPNQRSPYFHQQQLKRMLPVRLDTLVRYDSATATYRLRVPRRLEIHHATPDPVKSFYKDKPDEVAWIESGSGFVRFNAAGLLLNPGDCRLSGYLVEHRVADMLPLGYSPDMAASVRRVATRKATRLNNWIESPFFVTDRTYYFNRDTIRVAGVMRYQNSAYADSLSTILYIEVIDPEHTKLISRQQIKIDNGQFTALVPLVINASATKTVLLRTYTNWMRNFGDSCYAYRWVPVVATTQRIASLETEKIPFSTYYSYSITDSAIVVEPVAGFGERLAWGTLSIAETALQPKLAGSNFYPATPIDLLDTLPLNRFCVEQGIRLSGRLAKPKTKRGTYAMLVLPEQKLSYYADVDEAGTFRFEGLPAEGTQPVVLTFLSEKGLPLKQPVAVFDTTASLSWLPKLPANVGPAQLRSDVAWAGTPIDQTLNEVVVKAKKAPKPPKSLYQTADYTLYAKDLFDRAVGTNILTALQGRVSGLSIVEILDEAGFPKLVIRMRGSRSSLQQSTVPQPLVLVDGVPFENINQLQQIPPSQVERIEVVNRAENKLGLRGYVGVISIITKAMATDTETGQASESTVVTRQFTGYQEPAAMPQLNLVVHYPQVDQKLLRIPLPRKKGSYTIVAEGLLKDGTTYRASSVISR